MYLVFTVVKLGFFVLIFYKEKDKVYPFKLLNFVVRKIKYAKR